MKLSTDRILTTHVGKMDPEISWRKLQSLVEGAARATKRLWG